MTTLCDGFPLKSTIQASSSSSSSSSWKGVCNWPKAGTEAILHQQNRPYYQNINVYNNLHISLHAAELMFTSLLKLWRAVRIVSCSPVSIFSMIAFTSIFIIIELAATSSWIHRQSSFLFVCQSKSVYTLWLSPPTNDGMMSESPPAGEKRLTERISAKQVLRSGAPGKDGRTIVPG